MIYKIAICDDNEIDIRYITSLVTCWAESANVPIQIDSFPSAEALLFRYSEKKDYDMLLLDIEMSNMDGVTLAKTIRKDNETVQIIFITGYSDYIAEGYEVSALHYLVKPVQKEKLFHVLDRAVEKIKRNERVLMLQLSGEIVRVPFYEIRYLEVCKNYVTVHGKVDYTVKKALGEFAEELDERFFRAGRSYIINLTLIQRVTKTVVYLTDGTAIPLPRGVYEPLNRAIISRI